VVVGEIGRSASGDKRHRKQHVGIVGDCRCPADLPLLVVCRVALILNDKAVAALVKREEDVDVITEIVDVR
jgi:hypothetical protein